MQNDECRMINQNVIPILHSSFIILHSLHDECRMMNQNVIPILHSSFIILHSLHPSPLINPCAFSFRISTVYSPTICPFSRSPVLASALYWKLRPASGNTSRRLLSRRKTHPLGAH